jgi:hypothetical protein
MTHCYWLLSYYGANSTKKLNVCAIHIYCMSIFFLFLCLFEKNKISKLIEICKMTARFFYTQPLQINLVNLVDHSTPSLGLLYRDFFFDTQPLQINLVKLVDPSTPSPELFY